MTQNEIILEVLRRGEGLTAAEALYRFGIGRLASRICDLRKAGYPILSIRTKGKNRFGGKVYYDVYRLDRGRHGDSNSESVQG